MRRGSDGNRRQGRRLVNDRTGRIAGRNRGDRVAVGVVRGDNHLDLVALVALGNQVGRAGGAGDVVRGQAAVGRGLPLIGERGFARLVGDRHRRQRLPFLRRAIDRHRQGRRLVNDRTGRIAGRNRGDRVAVGVVRGDNHLDLVALVALGNQVGRAGGAGDVVRGQAAVGRGLPLIGERGFARLVGDRHRRQRLPFLRRAIDRHRQGRRLVNDRTGRIAGRNRGDRVAVGVVRGDNHLDLVALVALGNQVGRAGGAGDVVRGQAAVGRGLPLIGERGFARLVGDRHRRQRLPFLRRAIDRHRQGRRLVNDRTGRIAGRNRGDRVAVGVVRGDNHLDLVALVALGNQVGRAGGAGDVVRGQAAVGRGLPLIGERGFARLVGDRHRRQRLPFLRRAIDRHRQGRRLVNDRTGRIAGRNRGDRVAVGVVRGDNHLDLV